MIFTIEQAIALALKAHARQKDKAGAPYILHPLRLMLCMTSEKTMITAVLHDVVEDTDWTLEKLRSKGLSEEILVALDCLTHREKESYKAFIERLKQNQLARQVKLADLEDNMNILRFRALTAEDRKRLEKYHRAWRLLKDEES